MTTAAWVAFALAVAAAVVDWWAVGADRHRVEYAAKPAVLIALVAAALLLEPADAAVRAAMVVGLVFGLAGDVLLMLDRFVPGAAAFLAGHVAYIVALLLLPLHPGPLAVGMLLLAALLALVARPVLVGAARRSRLLGGIVAVYLVALGAVLVLGVGTAVPAAMLGVAFFAVSDALLAYGRFVAPAPGGRVAVHVTYHVGQALLALSLLWLGG